MAYSSSSSSLAGLVTLALLLSSNPVRVNSDVSCTQAIAYLIPCQPFLMGTSDISASCCLGAQTLLSQVASSQADRKSVCECLKQAALSVDINPDKAMQLPQLCKISVPITIQPNLDCDAIAFDDVRFRLNRYKNMEMKAFRPTTPGHSPGMGHPADLARKESVNL